ncbi:type II toxin-antitoxin system HicB family antitoxin [Xylella fastidiosa subsp. multiplex]|uniref:type II toxin-antitoxin system HicB family antitoxin n=1 Tax=Xylella fastidiosa TaxID=2371 RepID=UPI0023621823|nr:type II toxin-antitoxin system HicB family antitoxin [Xylella fastidiosa]MDD0928153.1 type II toxin-antitoxin system HicB family antitoxin [Xylella fastidiosa subsp. multiplex]
MKNIMTIESFKAIIAYDPEIDMFRGEFVGINGGADFYAKDLKGLRREGAISLKVFLEACKEDSVEPRKCYSGKFNARISPELHALASEAAAAQGISLNQFVEQAIQHEVHT